MVPKEKKKWKGRRKRLEKGVEMAMGVYYCCWFGRERKGKSANGLTPAKLHTIKEVL